MCTIGIFIIGYALSNVLLLLGINKNSSTGMFSRLVAGTRYLTYRGFRIEALGWNSAPVGALLLALVGTIYFFCESYSLFLAADLRERENWAD